MLDHVKTTTLDNGCRIVTSTMPGVESLAVGLFSTVGSRYETHRQSGHSHFLEHMLFKGSAKRSARAISQAIESRGGNMNAYTNFESTVYYAVAPSTAAALTTDVLGDMYLFPKLTKSDVDKERTVILEEVNMYHDQPDAHVVDLAQQALWTRHPLGNQILGTVDSLNATTAESLREYHDYHYNAPCTVIAAAGNITHEKFLDLAARYALQLPVGAVRKCKAATAATPMTRLIFDRRETEQVQAVIGYRTCGRYDPQRHTLNMLNVVLGGNMSSRLFQVVREKHGLAYSVSSFTSFYNDSGAFQVSAGLDRKRSVKALELCAAEIRKIACTPVPKAEFERARDYMLGCLRLGLETARSHMSWIGNGTLRNQLITPAQAMENVKRVTREEVLAMAADIFKPENTTLTLVMPRTDVAEPEEHLAAVAL